MPHTVRTHQQGVMAPMGGYATAMASTSAPSAPMCYFESYPGGCRNGANCPYPHYGMPPAVGQPVMMSPPPADPSMPMYMNPNPSAPAGAVVHHHHAPPSLTGANPRRTGTKVDVVPYLTVVNDSMLVNKKGYIRSK